MYRLSQRLKNYNYKRLYHDFNHKTLKSNTIIYLKLLMRKYHRQKLSTQIFITFSIFTIFLLFLFSTVYIFYNVKNSSSFMEKKTCPVCFGFKACKKFEENHIKLTLPSTIKAFFGFNSNIYKGVYSDGSELVISRIENSSLIRNWEEKICLKVKFKAFNKRNITLFDFDF